MSTEFGSAVSLAEIAASWPPSAASIAQIHHIEAHPGDPRLLSTGGVTFAPGNRTFAVSEVDGKATVWDATRPANPTPLAILDTSWAVSWITYRGVRHGNLGAATGRRCAGKSERGKSGSSHSSGHRDTASMKAWSSSAASLVATARD